MRSSASTALMTVCGLTTCAKNRLRSRLVTRILAGASIEVDIATIGDLTAQTDRLAKILERPHARFDRRAAGKAPRAANLPFVLSLGRPPNGMLWFVEWVVLMGDDPSASAAIANVRAALFAGSPPTDAQLSGGAVLVGADFANAILPGLIIPTTQTVPDKNVVYSNEELYFIVAGTGTVAGAANYHAAAGVLELPQRPDALMW